MHSPSFTVTLFVDGLSSYLAMTRIPKQRVSVRIERACLMHFAPRVQISAYAKWPHVDGLRENFRIKVIDEHLRKADNFDKVSRSARVVLR